MASQSILQDNNDKKTAGAVSVGSFLCILSIKCFAVGREEISFSFSFYFAGVSAGVSAAPEAGKEGTF